MKFGPRRRSTFPTSPDAIKPLVGYRMWKYTIVPGAVGLHALSCDGGPLPDGCGWEDRGSAWATASCSRRVHRPGAIPHENCFCGFYAMRSLDRLLEQAPLPLSAVLGGDFDPSSDEDMVLGRVYLAGKVIEHEDGFRAKNARVAELFPFEGSEPKIMRLASRLGVPVGPSVRLLQPVDEVVPSEPWDDHVRLSDHEREVVRLVARGYSVEQIAHCLSLGRSMVRAYMDSILEKLRAHDGLQMVLFRRPSILLRLAEAHDLAFDQARPSGTPPSWRGCSLN
jgi:DNA-binding CsgD family transcriptional regulator